MFKYPFQQTLNWILLKTDRLLTVAKVMLCKKKHERCFGCVSEQPYGGGGVTCLHVEGQFGGISEEHAPGESEGEETRDVGEVDLVEQLE